MSTFSKLLLLAISTIVLSSCGVSPLEKEQRRANAFDISGHYGITNDLTLDIVNESDRSNVYGIVNRGNFTRDEEAAFARQNISLNNVEKFRTQFQLGMGTNNRIEGGENISDDMGASSRLFITTNYSESLELDNDTISYSISANVSKNDFVLRGKIIMSINHIETTDGKTSITTKERIEIPFAAKNNSLFVNQYMGTWDGKMTTDDQAMNNALAYIMIQKTNDQNFEVICNLSTFVFKGEQFKLTRKTLNFDLLASTEFPEVNLEFVGNMDSKIEVMGNIYSLGMFSGVVVKSDKNKNIEQVGNFQFKRR